MRNCATARRCCWNRTRSSKSSQRNPARIPTGFLSTRRSARWPKPRASAYRNEKAAPAPRASELRDQFCDDEDQQTDEAADQGSVDADILQVLADLQLEPVDERGGVPIFHDI